MMDVKKELMAIIDAKTGNKEMAIFFMPENEHWCIELGNTSSFVLLGETKGELESYDSTLEGAILKMKDKLRI